MNESLLRPIRKAPHQPTATELVALLKEYGLRRWRAAQLMHVAEVTFNRYCLPPTSRHARPIPLIRWRVLKGALVGIDQQQALAGP